MDDLCEAYGLTPAAALGEPESLYLNQTIRNVAAAYKKREMDRIQTEAAAGRG